MALTARDHVEMYRLMLLSRRFSERVMEWYKEGRLTQGLHPSIGQEAVGVGACYGLRRTDWVIPSLRAIEVFWTRGVTVLQQFNAMFGNTGSISRGKETSHHSGYPHLGIVAGTGIVGGHIPVTVGMALGLRLQGRDDVALCTFGDGAANRGDFHEALNLAAARKAPAVFICENNLYAQTVPASVSMAIKDIADRALGYGMPGVVVDGQDVLAVYDATQEAVARARAGAGPTLLEVKTYRFQVHYPVIFQEKRPAEEREPWLRRDPLAIQEQRIREMGAADDATLTSMDAAIQREIVEAVQQAEATPKPDPREVFENLYQEPAGEMGL